MAGFAEELSLCVGSCAAIRSVRQDLTRSLNHISRFRDFAIV